MRDVQERNTKKKRKKNDYTSAPVADLRQTVACAAISLFPASMLMHFARLIAPVSSREHPCLIKNNCVVNGRVSYFAVLRPADFFFRSCPLFAYSRFHDGLSCFQYDAIGTTFGTFCIQFAICTKCTLADPAAGFRGGGQLGAGSQPRVPQN